MSDDADLLDGYDAQESFERLTREAHEARGRGDRDEAQRLFDQRARVAEKHDVSDENARTREDAPTRSGEPDEPGIPGEHDVDIEGPEPFTDTRTREVFQFLRDSGVAEEGISALAREWGNDANANLAYANEAALEIEEANPDLARRADAIAEENPDFRLGLIKLLAGVGREARHGDRTLMEILTEETTGMSNAQGAPSAKGEAEMERLTKEAHAAKHAGDFMKAQDLFNKRAALARSLYGDAPIVGGDPQRNF